MTKNELELQLAHVLLSGQWNTSDGKTCLVELNGRTYQYLDIDGEVAVAVYLNGERGRSRVIKSGDAVSLLNEMSDQVLERYHSERAAQQAEDDLADLVQFLKLLG